MSIKKIARSPKRGNHKSLASASTPKLTKTERQVLGDIRGLTDCARRDVLRVLTACADKLEGCDETLDDLRPLFGVLNALAAIDGELDSVNVSADEGDYARSGELMS